MANGRGFSRAVGFPQVAEQLRGEGLVVVAAGPTPEAGQVLLLGGGQAPRIKGPAGHQRLPPGKPPPFVQPQAVPLAAQPAQIGGGTGLNPALPMPKQGLVTVKPEPAGHQLGGIVAIPEQIHQLLEGHISNAPLSFLHQQQPGFTELAPLGSGRLQPGGMELPGGVDQAPWRLGNGAGQGQQKLQVPQGHLLAAAFEADLQIDPTAPKGLDNR
jgi:hypothetical protein